MIQWGAFVRAHHFIGEGDSPLVDFMIVGVQKGGTSALASFLYQHPALCMSVPKEVHLFDAPDYSHDWTAAQIDARYRPCFAHCDDGTLRGEATPIYLFLPEVAAELKRYNPALKLIVLLRDPVERAVSHYYMEKNRDRERLPLWLALLAEPFRLRRREDTTHVDSHLRRHAYRRRGLYSLQLRNLYRHFDHDRVLIVRSEELLHHHDAVLRRVFAFLGVTEDVRIPPRIVYAGDRGGRRHPVVSRLLGLFYLAERQRLRRLWR